jgi:hypothetical protein
MACRMRVSVVFVEQVLMAGLDPKRVFSPGGAHKWLSCVLIAAAWRQAASISRGALQTAGMNVASL